MNRYKKIATILCLCIVTGFAQTSTFVHQNGADYYESAYKLYGTALRLALHNIIKGHTAVSYAALWTHFQTTDKKSNGKVWDMYSDIPGGIPPYEFTFVSNQCGNYSGESSCYNREHSWPKSWFNDLDPMYTDMFHLFPTDGYVNGKRSNYNYGNVTNPTWTSMNGSKLGLNTFPGYGGLVFEPIDAYKGDLARGHFYMSVRYYTEDGGWSTSDGTNKSNLLPWYASLLYSWHSRDSVSKKEIDRNNAIFGIQKNRNPFIDHPEFAAEIWNTGASPILQSIIDSSASEFLIDFSRYLDSASATSILNYTIDQNIGNPIAVQWGVNNDVSKIILTTATLMPGTIYSIQIKNLKSINDVPMKDTVITVKTSGVLNSILKKPLQLNFSLEQNYPNPFNPSTEIRFTLPTAGFTSLQVSTILGKETATLIHERMEAGNHSVRFDAGQLPSGIYLLTLRAGSIFESRKMLLMK